MSGRELERVEVMGRVASGDVKLSDAGVMLELSYRQTKRLWRRYVQVGRKWAEAWERRSAFESQQAAEASAPSAEFSQEEIFRFGGGRDSGQRWRPSTWPRKTAL